MHHKAKNKYYEIIMPSTAQLYIVSIIKRRDSASIAAFFRKLNYLISFSPPPSLQNSSLHCTEYTTSTQSTRNPSMPSFPPLVSRVIPLPKPVAIHFIISLFVIKLPPKNNKREKNKIVVVWCHMCCGTNRKRKDQNLVCKRPIESGLTQQDGRMAHRRRRSDSELEPDLLLLAGSKYTVLLRLVCPKLFILMFSPAGRVSPRVDHFLLLDF